MAQAVGGGAVAGHLVKALVVPLAQLLTGGFVQVGVVVGVVDEPAGGHHVLAGEQQSADRLAAVAPGSSRLLVVGFKILGHIVMYHEADV